VNISQLVALTKWWSESDGGTERKMEIAKRVQRIAEAKNIELDGRRAQWDRVDNGLNEVGHDPEPVPSTSHPHNLFP
jgi:hypothetical protein